MLEQITLINFGNAPYELFCLEEHFPKLALIPLALYVETWKIVLRGYCFFCVGLSYL